MKGTPGVSDSCALSPQPQHMQGFVGSGSSRRQGWVLPWLTSLAPAFSQQTHHLSDLSLGSKSGAAPSYRDQKGLESGDPSLPSVGLCFPMYSMGPQGRRSHLRGLITPHHCTVHFPGPIPRFPGRNPFLSTFKCFNLLHPPRRALREAGRMPRLRAIKQFTARGAELASGWEQGH